MHPSDRSLFVCERIIHLFDCFVRMNYAKFILTKQPGKFTPMVLKTLCFDDPCPFERGWQIPRYHIFLEFYPQLIFDEIGFLLAIDVFLIR